MLAAIDECWGYRTAAGTEDNGAALHEKAGKRAGFLPYNKCAGDHSAAGVGSGFALDDDGAPAHPVAGALAGAATDDDYAAAHSGDLSGQWAAEPLVSGAEDFDHAALHAGRGPGAGITAESQAAARHQSPRLDADIAIDEKLAAGHGLADMVEAVAGTLDANLLGVAHAHPEDLGDIDAHACRLQLDPLDLRGGLAGKVMRDKRRQVEPLLGTLAQRESQRPHGTKSRKR